MLRSVSVTDLEKVILYNFLNENTDTSCLLLIFILIPTSWLEAAFTITVLCLTTTKFILIRKSQIHF